MLSRATSSIQNVTVLIATFNHGQYIGEAVESVMENAADLEEHGVKTKIEIIVMDDGSKDNTKEVLERCAELSSSEHVTFKYFYQENQGQAAAYQNALEHITGDYVMLLDSDDRFLKNKIREVLAVFEKDNSLGLVGHPLYVMDSSGTNTGEVRPKAAKISCGDISSEIRKFGRNVAPPTTGLTFRRDVFARVHPSPLYGMPSAADAYLTISSSLVAKVAALDVPLAEYRQHNESQYVKRLTSVDGLRRTIVTQTKILSHLNLEHTMKSNSYFTRHNYVLSRMEKPAGEWLNEWSHLIAAIMKDPFIASKNKLLMIGFWSLSLFMTKKMFWKYWIYFQIKHTGNRKLKELKTNHAGSIV